MINKVREVLLFEKKGERHDYDMRNKIREIITIWETI